MPSSFICSNGYCNRIIDHDNYHEVPGRALDVLWENFENERLAIRGGERERET